MSLKPTATANERRPERRRRFLVSSSLDKPHRFFHYFSRATDAGDDARPLDGDNGMCDDDGLLRSWTLLDDDEEEGPAGAGKAQPSDAKDISMVIQNDQLFIIFSFFTL